jgi:hypothetical protein
MSERIKSYEYVGASGTMSCSPSGAGGFTGCGLAEINKAYAEKIVRAYWKRYAPKSATLEQLARIHNGGPRGHLNPNTIKYWNKIKKELVK